MALTALLETASKNSVLGEVLDLKNTIVRLATEDYTDNPLELLPAVIRDLGRLRDRACSDEEKDVLNEVDNWPCKT